jgi:hypothetical protein
MSKRKPVTKMSNTELQDEIAKWLGSEWAQWTDRPRWFDDMNAAIDLLKEVCKDGYNLTWRGTWEVLIHFDAPSYTGILASHENPARAICEAYCNKKRMEETNE